MKQSTKHVLAALGMAAVGFLAYTLWEEDAIQTKIRQKKTNAEKRAEFIARRKALAQAKREAAAKAQEPAETVQAAQAL